MIVDIECPTCNGNGEVQSQSPSRRSRFVSYDDLSPDDFTETCPECGGFGSVEDDPEDEIEDWMRD